MPIKLISSGGGSIILDAPSTGSNFTLTVPTTSANLVSDTHTGNVAITGRVSAVGITSTANVSVTGAISATGKLLSTVTSQNYAVSSATAITVNTTTPTAIASVTLTTTGKPVFLVASGDQNPNQTGGWHYNQFYRNGSGIGRFIINENSGGVSKNCPFCITHIDLPPAGTHTYDVRAWQGSGSMTYGETGDVQAPTIVAVELI